MYSKGLYDHYKGSLPITSMYGIFIKNQPHVGNDTFILWVSGSKKHINFQNQLENGIRYPKQTDHLLRIAKDGDDNVDEFISPLKVGRENPI